MKKYRRSLLNVLLISLLFFHGDLSLATTDSSSVKPQTVTSTAMLVIANVMHYFNALSSTPATPPTNSNCPNGSIKEWGSYSPVGGKTVFYYICGESYFSIDPYYQSLVSNIWVTCNSSPGIGVTGNCSIKVQKPPVVTFVAPVPANTNEYVSSGAHIRFYDAILWINGTRINSNYTTSAAEITVPYLFDSSATPALRSNMSIGWEIEGPTVSGSAWTSSVFNYGANWGTYYCGPNWVTIPANLFGGTCYVTCTAWTYSPGTYNSAPWRNSSWTGDNWVGTLPVMTCVPNA